MRFTFPCGLLFAAMLSGCVPLQSSRPIPRHPPAGPAAFWLDLIAAEEVSLATVVDDLARAGVVYVGETHTIARHHAVQLELLQQLFARGLPLVLCLEQLEAHTQPAVDRFNQGEIDFMALARDIDWPESWSNYADYRPLCEFAQQHRIPVRALNAPAALVRTINRGGGVAQLSPEQRAQLPADLELNTPDYEQLMNLQLGVHAAAHPGNLRAMFEAQIARDEFMATHILAARTIDPTTPRVAFVVVGAGHVQYGLGTAASVRRRDSAIADRIVLLSESGQLQLTATETAASRPITISHADLRALRRAPGDYLHFLPHVRPSALPRGHPPLGNVPR